MTCVIAMRDPSSNRIHMAADRAISAGNAIVNKGGAKLVKFPSGLLVGFAGALATQNLMVTCPELYECDLSNDKSVATLFNKFSGVAGFQLPGAAPTTFWAVMLLALGDAFVWMGNLGGWSRVADPVRAIGEGEPVALGSWYARADLEPKERLARAIEAASVFMPGVVSRECDYDHT
jgi:ATP-dependent protease HslVU (ClpYQ) peptidase subunit